jgi:hypothetical protein
MNMSACLNRCHAAAVAVLLGLVQSAPGQDWRIDLATFAGGGGKSSASPVVLDATLGQPLVGSSAGGVFTLTGGFQALDTPPLPAAPRLAISRGAGSTLLLRWPSDSPGWTLQRNEQGIGSGQWLNVGVVPADDGTFKSITLQPTSGNLFFRLHWQ